MRHRISEMNMFPDFDITTEYKKLHILFCNDSAFDYMRPIGIRSLSLSFRDVLEDIFLDWNLRGSFTTVKEMLCGLGISDKEMKDEPTEDQLLDYIQFILNACVFVLSEVKNNEIGFSFDRNAKVFNTISAQARAIVDRLGAEIVDDGEELFITYKNDVAIAVAEQNKDIKPSIVEYLKIDNRGNLTRKAEILCTLAKALEPYERKLKGTEFGALCSDTTKLLNKIGPRHALDDKDPLERKAIAMTPEDQEKWYDRIFQMFLACMAAVPYVGFKGEIKDLQKED